MTCDSASVAAWLGAAVVDGALSARLGFRLTVRRAFLLRIACDEPIGVPEIRAAVAGMAGTRWHDTLRRLSHQRAAYVDLGRLEDFGAMRRERAGRRVFFHVEPAARRVIEPAVARVARPAGVAVSG